MVGPRCVGGEAGSHLGHAIGYRPLACWPVGLLAGGPWVAGWRELGVYSPSESAGASQHLVHPECGTDTHAGDVVACA